MLVHLRRAITLSLLSMLVVGFLYAYRRQLARRVYLLYGVGGLFLMGVGIRALLTAHG